MDLHDLPPRGVRILDDDTADRLLSGGVAPDDAPPGYRIVARIIAALRAPAMPSERFGAGATADRRDRVAAASPPSGRRRVHRLQLTGAGLIGSATLLLGLAGAGALPGQAQSVAATVLERVGISVPTPNSHRGAADQGSSGSDSGKGSEISSLAHTTPSGTPGKGATVSPVASGGASRAGSQPATDPSTPTTAEPGNQGTGVAAGENPPSDPSAGATPNGSAATGADNRDGKSTLGSGNSTTTTTTGNGNAAKP